MRARATRLPIPNNRLQGEKFLNRTVRQEVLELAPERLTRQNFRDLFLYIGYLRLRAVIVRMENIWSL